MLHALHPDKRGRLRLPPAPAATVALVAAGIVTRRPWLLAAALAPPLVDAARRARRLRRSGVRVPAAQVAFSTLRGHLSALYFVSFRLVRYHLWPLAALGVVVPGVRLLGAACRRVRGRRRLHARAGRASASRRTWASTSAEHAAYQTGRVRGPPPALRRRGPIGRERAAAPRPVPCRPRGACVLGAAHAELAMRT